MTSCISSRGHMRLDRGSSAVVTSDPSWPTQWLEEVERRVADLDLGGEYVVVFSSGTTSRPRGIVRTLASWEASALHFAELAGVGSSDVVAVPGPPHSTVFAHGAFHARHVGATVVEQPNESTTVVHATPGLIPTLLARCKRGELPSLRAVTSGGDRLPDHLWRRAEKCGVAMLDYYGAAELSFVGYRTQPGPYLVFPGVTVEVREDVAWVSSPYVADRPLDPAQTGQWRVHGKWHSVGDVVREVDGGIDVRGRGGAITTGGHTVIMADVEQHALALSGVQACVAVGRACSKLGQRLDLVVAGDVTEHAVRDHFSVLPAASRPGRVVVCDHMPLLPSGKTDRARAADLTRGNQR